MYRGIHEEVKNGKILSAYAVCAGGVAEAVSKMAFGNWLGVSMTGALNKAELFAPGFGNIVAEVSEDVLDEITVPYTLIGEVTGEPVFTYQNVSISMNDALTAWKSTLEKVFPSVSGEVQPKVDTPLYKAKHVYVCKNKVAKPRVLFQYSQVQTVNTTVQKLLNVRGRRFRKSCQKYDRRGYP